MAPKTDLSSVNTARASHTLARRTLVSALHTYEKALAAYQQVQRVDEDSENSAAKEALDDAVTALDGARSSVNSANQTLQDELDSWMADASQPDDDLYRLGEYGPIVLLPVRLETRFDNGQLKIRMFPDEFFINTHETALTEDEYSAAKDYYTTLSRTVDSEPGLWRDLVARFGAPRAAYILRRMLPVFGDVPTSSTSCTSTSTCGVTLTGGGRQALTFPDAIDPNSIQFRSGTWTRPGEAVLPDRWVVVAQSVERRVVAVGKRIPEPLAVTVDPDVRTGDLVPIAGELSIDKRILWTVDYAEALKVGMAVSIDLVGSESMLGFDRIMVIGVKTSMNPIDTSRHLEMLLDAHHYTRGMALVRQGTPTNNMEGQPTSYPPRDNAAQASFLRERRPAPVDPDYSYHCLPPQCDGTALASVLGVPSGVFANLDRARQYEIARAKDMNTLLWSGTMGYYLRNMMAPVFSWDWIGWTRKYFQNWVLARGPAPAIRIGGTPYGVLPIVSLADYSCYDPYGVHTEELAKLQQLEGTLQKPLQSLLDIWLQAAEKVPVVRPGQANPDVDLATVLSTTPSSKQFWIRQGKGHDVNYLHYWINGWDFQMLRDWMDLQAGKLFARIGYPTWKPRVGRVQFNDEAWTYHGIVVATRPREDRYLNPNFLAAVAATRPHHFNENPGYWGASTSLFYKVVRHSLLNEYLYAYLGSHGTLGAWYEHEVFDLNEWSYRALNAILNSISQDDLATYAGPALNAATNLSGESTAELERLFTETLDLTSHRLDAWITALANRRLERIREQQIRAYGTPKGDRLGGCGWLEDVRPREQNFETVGSVVAEVRPHNGGFVHTPSLTHAAAAAVLRNAHMSFAQYENSTYAVDLSSRRVRNARWLLDGLRSGQPLGALLGYQFERGLHEGNVTNDVTLEQCRFQLRNQFPLVANQSGNDPGTPADEIAARNVVDGLALLRAYQRDELDFGSGGLPTAVATELGKLAESFDGVADMMTAESVFQLVSGNVDAAVPTINNLAAGKQPPVSVFTRSARGGIGIAHKVALVFPADERPTLDPTIWPVDPDPSKLPPRTQAEPTLNAWLGQMIGSPHAVSCTVTYFDDEGEPIPNTHLDGTGTPVVTYAIGVTLYELGLHPLDLFAIAASPAKQDQGSILDRRIVAAAYADPEKKPDTTPASVKVSYTDLAGAGHRSFPEILEILATAGTLLRASRPLAVSDLLAPAEAEVLEPEKGGTNAVAFFNRATAVAGRFSQALTILDTAITSGANYRIALTGVATYLPFSAFPDPTLGDAALKAAAEAALAEMNRKASALPRPLGTAPANIVNEELIAHATQTLKAIFGEDFVALPEVDPPQAAELDLSLGARSTLLAGEDDAPDKYLQQIARARERIGRWRKLNLYARASGLPRPKVDIAQLPYVPGETWLGMPFSTPPTSGRTALLFLNYAATLDAGETWAGLLMDDWSEIIPNETEQTGIAMHYESPQAQAPQAILVAVPAAQDYHWKFAPLSNAVEQTMNLMKIRAVSLEDLDLGQALPMNMFATNSTSYDYTVSTIFDALRRGVFTKGLVP